MSLQQCEFCIGAHWQVQGAKSDQLMYIVYHGNPLGAPEAIKRYGLYQGEGLVAKGGTQNFTEEEIAKLCDIAICGDRDITESYGCPLKESNTDLGFVPLLHLYGVYFFNDRLSAILDIEGAGASQGRAIDAALKVAYKWPCGWHAGAGYRTLEGGADNNSVYTFAWLHFAFFEIGYAF